MKQRKTPQKKWQNTDSTVASGTMPLVSNIEDLKRYELYSAFTNTLKVQPLIAGLKVFSTELEELTRFMLETRFIQLPTRGKKKSRIRDNEGNLLAARKPLDTDLMRYLGIGKKEKHTPANPLDIIKFFKGLENYILSKKMNIDFNELNLGHFESSCRSLVDNLPILLLSIEKLDSSQKKWNLTYLFSIIIIYRQFKVKTSPDLLPIEAPFSGASMEKIESLFTDESMLEWIENNFSSSTLAKDIIIKFYSGNASSPNSLSSTSKLLEDAWAVKQDERLSKAILELSDFFEGGRQFRHFVETLFLNIWDMPKAIHSKLFHFTAPGGKARIIANVDFLTQTVLSGMHYYFFYLLKDMKSDQTFDHKKGLDHIVRPKGHYYSIDLTSATDRMPRFLEQKLIKNLFNKRGENGDRISELWETIIDREFTPEQSMNNGKLIKYSVGQGMGIFTSWSSMSLLHHYIVNQLCKIAHSDYALVGDDLVIRDNKKAYLQYLDIMSMIGVTVNKTKTLESETCDANIEFARNYIIRSEKIKPLQYGLLFAWADEKTSIETVLFNSDWSNNKECLERFLITFRKYFSLKKAVYMLFANHKYDQELINIETLSKIFDLPEWVKKIDFKLIKKITHNEDEKLSSLILEDRSPLSTLKSKLVVRTMEDVQKVTELAERFVMLKFVDDEIAKIAVVYHDRMNNVSLIQYDADFLGNPYFTKKELRLIDQIIEYTQKHN